MSDKKELFLTPQSGCFKCSSIHYHATWQECADFNDLAIRKKDLEIQILRDRLYKNLAMSWKDDSEGRNKAYQNINAEIETAKGEVE